MSIFLFIFYQHDENFSIRATMRYVYCVRCGYNAYGKHVCWWGHFKYTGLYGNDDLHNGLLEVLSSGRKVDKIISSVRNQTQILESTLANKIRPQLVELADIFDQPASNQTALSQLILSLNIVQGNVTTAKNAAADIRRPLMQVTISQFLSVSFTLATTV